MARLWLQHARDDHWRRKPGEPRDVIATVTFEPGKDREASAIVAMARAMDGISPDVPLSVCRVGGRSIHRASHFDGLVDVEQRRPEKGDTLGRLYYAWWGVDGEPWRLKDENDFRLLDLGTAVGVGKVQEIPPWRTEPSVPVSTPCSHPDCPHPYDDHFVTEGWLVACQACGRECGGVSP